MTANELLSLLGRAWSRLLIYPGGLTAFGVIWLLSLLQNHVLSAANHNHVPDLTEDEGRKTARIRLPSFVLRQQKAGSNIQLAVLSTKHHRIETIAGSWFLVLSSITPAWLALALLPLPLAVSLPRQIDSIIALALLEWPHLLAIRQDLRMGNMRRLAAALNSYPPLILAILALAQAGNSLELAALARLPGDLTTTSAIALHWLGAIALTLALPPALGIGPFAAERPTTNDERRMTHDERRMTHDERGATTDHRPPTTEYRPPTTDDRTLTSDEQYPTPDTRHPTPITIGLRLRALGLVMLAALPWAGAEGDAVALLRMLGAAALIAALVWGFDRLTRGQAARRWAWAYLGLDMVLLLALLGAAYLALQLRLA